MKVSLENGRNWNKIFGENEWQNAVHNTLPSQFVIIFEKKKERMIGVCKKKNQITENNRDIHNLHARILQILKWNLL